MKDNQMDPILKWHFAVESAGICTVRNQEAKPWHWHDVDYHCDVNLTGALK